MIEASHVLILAGALAGGFVNGLTGFGTALTAMPFWLFAVPPVIAAQLAAAGGAIGQIQSLPSLRHAIEWPKIAPYILAGLAGVPVGTLILPHASVAAFKLGIGIVLVTYCGFALLMQGLFPGRVLVPRASRAADAAVGFAGGILAGLAGLSGPLPGIWAGLRNLPRDERRALFACFNLVMLATMLLMTAVQGLMTREFALALAVALPGTITGAWLGRAVYRRLDDRRFDRVVLALLMLSGLSLMWTALRS